MAVYGKNFEFNGKNSSDFGIMLAGFEEISSIPMGLDREVNRGEANIYRHKRNHFGATYTSPLEFELSIIKNIEEDQRDMIFSRNEIRSITAWLTSPLYPELFHMTDYGFDTYLEDQVDYYVTFSSIEDVVVNGGIVGLTIKATCDCPFGYSREFTKEISANSSITIMNTTDDYESFIYPVIKIDPSDDGQITISNNTENKSISIKSKGANNTVYIDCQRLEIKDYIGSLIPLSDLGINNPANIYFPRLLHGQNEISVDGNAKVTLSYREYRKVGAY